MKNLSFGKMLAMFGGFILLLIVCAVVIIKLTAKAPAAPQVTTKKYTPPARTDNRVAEQTDLQIPDGNGPARQALSDPQAPVAGTNRTQKQGTPAALPANPTPVIVADVKPHLNSLDASVTELEARVVALENRQHAIVTPQAAARPAAVRRTAAKSKPVPVREVVPAKPLTPLPGYKSMAVIGNRAWLATPDGQEDSVSAGDPIPRPRVRSLDKETGVVVTTSDERIGAH